MVETLVKDHVASLAVEVRPGHDRGVHAGGDHGLDQPAGKINTYFVYIL